MANPLRPTPVTLYNEDGTPAGGTGGGPATIADGADVAGGARADGAWDGSAASTTRMAVLKGIFGRLGTIVLGAGTAAIGKVGLQVGGADVASGNPVPTSSTAQGAVADTLATNTTGSWSNIALLKGMLAALGFQADAATASGAAGSIASYLRSIRDAMVAATPAGTNVIGAVFPAMSTNPATTQVNVPATGGTGTNGATQILASTGANTPRELKNTGTNTVFIGPNTVSASTGHALLAGEAFTPWWTGAVFGITASGTSVVTACV